MARCPGLAQGGSDLGLWPAQAAEPAHLHWVQGAEISGQTKPGREARHTPHPRLPRAWGWPHAGVPVPTLPNGRELPPRVSAGFPHPAPGQKPVHPVSLSTRLQSTRGPRTDWLQRQTPPRPVRQGPGRRNRTCRAPPRRAPVWPGNRGTGETPARRAKCPTPMPGTSAFPPAPRAQGRGAGVRPAGSYHPPPRPAPRPAPTRASWEGAGPQRSALPDPDLLATSRRIAPPPQPLQAGARAPQGV